MYPILRNVLNYWGWADYTPTIPKLYWDVESQEERIKKICKELHKLCEYANYLGENINLDHETIEKIYEEFEKYIESGFTDYYIDVLNKYIEEHFAEIMRKHMGIIWPAIDDTGHFVLYSATIMDLSFDVMQSKDENFGRIVIKY
jgi:hypothetical protein